MSQEVVSKTEVPPRWIRLVRVALTGYAAVFFALGWLAGRSGLGWLAVRIWFAGVFAADAVRTGYLDGMGRPRLPQQQQRQMPRPDNSKMDAVT